MLEPYVMDLREIDATQVAAVGGKAAHLGELTRIDGVRVPAGFCVTTAAWRRTVAIDDQLDRLSRLGLADRVAIAGLSAEIRRTIEEVAVPSDLAAAVDPEVAYAVRSSATAEDMPTASFAGQQDTYLNVVGTAAVLAHIGRCWASLFTERAVTYRLRHGIDHRTVHMAVVVQEMVFAEAAGILFTADPVSGNRKVATVDAGFGLGEALVGGLVDPDVFKVRDDAITERTIAAKQRAVQAVPGGGTQVVAIDGDQPALTDAQVIRLVELGRRIEAHFGRPQDIEWCRTGDDFAIVQSRPITTLFPVPAVTDDANHVYLSVGHQQMMTDAMKPLGLSMWQLTAMAPMLEAGGRLFVDGTRMLTGATARASFLAMSARSDPLTADALRTVLDRGFIPEVADAGAVVPPSHGGKAPVEADPAIVPVLIERSQESTATLRRDIAAKTGPALFDFLLESFQEHKRVLGDPESMQAIMAGMGATWWLNDHLQEWLGEKNASDTLSLSAPGNITSEMGLALLDVADAIRPYPEAVAFLQDGGSLAELPPEPRAAVEGYLDKYGMRCAAEIDITRPRWSEQPGTLVPLILDNIELFEPGAGARRFEQGRREAEDKRRDILERLRALPDGESKADETVRVIDRLRAFIGYREYPKYNIICRYFVYKQALLAEADRLVQTGVLTDREDIFYLKFHELSEVVRSGKADEALIEQRKAGFEADRALKTPRVLTSEGETVEGSYRRDDAPAGALVGLAVSAGTVEGRARVILDMAQADLEAGDILVTAYTDPSWSPLFVAITGLVTEVGGLMTHGAVIAREYGLPAVVGVPDATRLIADGQRIRVHGSDGYIELLPD
ncbi:rifamycin-inactivating phosphotransferase [Paractinoplanes durhamensis]|uniref:Phosphoenolpyruvate synthase n=1 Tax=Paractinoplanes durhamensis TaxID=113563 RepID=A0ABQ3Z6T3_9ACTN|nr:rifamycin-inactivating phosphotransferase [Actinoplanes durhamensis]GIE05531.1 putative phosphoenolpyruvate synthase [Actinoplanes durhamensis]